MYHIQYMLKFGLFIGDIQRYGGSGCGRPRTGDRVLFPALRQWTWKGAFELGR